MNNSNEFRSLAMNAFFATFEHIQSEEQIRKLLFGDFKPEELQRLDIYLARNLDGRYSDKELSALWDTTGTDVRFLRPEDARVFLLKIREWLAEKNSPPEYSQR